MSWSKQTSHHHVPKKLRTDLSWWREFLPHWSGQKVLRSNDDLLWEDIGLFTDASGDLGAGGILGNRWWACGWSRDYQTNKNGIVRNLGLHSPVVSYPRQPPHHPQAAPFARTVSPYRPVSSRGPRPSRRNPSHSFRIGGATILAEAGYPDHIIKLAGRWKSDAFLHYIHRHEHILPQTAAVLAAFDINRLQHLHHH